MLVGGEKFTFEFDDVSGAVVTRVLTKSTWESPNDNEVKLGISGVMKLNPADGGSSSVSERVKRDGTYKDNFNVLFEFTSGLSNPVAGAGTTGLVCAA